MQQLSLFDFGEEAPKPEKKKKASKDVAEHSTPVTSTENPPENKPQMETSDADNHPQEEKLSELANTAAGQKPTNIPAEEAEQVNSPTDFTDSLDPTQAPIPAPQIQNEPSSSDPIPALREIEGNNQEIAVNIGRAEESQNTLEQQGEQQDAVLPSNAQAEKSVTPEISEGQQQESISGAPIEAQHTLEDSNEAELKAEAEAQNDTEATSNPGSEPPLNSEAPPERQTEAITTQLQVTQSNEPTKEVVFANEQFGVKVVTRTVTSQVTHSINVPPAPAASAENPDQEAIDTHQSESNPQTEASQQLYKQEQTEDATVDTSFSPDDFDSETPQEEETHLSIPQQQQATAVQSSNNIIPTNQPDVPVPPQIIENKGNTNITTDDEEVNHVEKEEQPSNNQEIGANNSTRKPFYVEDQTVPIRKRGRMSFKQIDAEVDLIQIPPDEELFQKQYYPISVVAKWFRVNNSLLRFWENEFKILKPRKNKKGDRFFRPEDIKNLQLIYYLLRQKKLTINGAIKHLNSYREQTEVNMQLIQSLTEFKGFLLELKHSIKK